MAASISSYLTFILEAMVMKLFAEYPSGFQRLVGLYPGKLSLVTKNAGRSLDCYACSNRLRPEQKLSVMTQICKIMSNLHQNGFAHNDVKLRNVCVMLAESGPKVTLIDYGITTPAG